jgi:Holliday junction resolvase RusA-like endonuclease
VSTISFTVYRKAEPQGSKRAFVVPGKNGKKARAVVVDNNKVVMRSYRTDVRNEATIAMQAAGMSQPMAGKQVPVEVTMTFTFLRPPSAKKRLYPSVAPDIDKLVRSSVDAIIGVLFQDDSQVVKLTASKHYGSPERVEITVSILGS